MSFQSRNKFQIVAVRARLERLDLYAFFPNSLIQRAGFQRGAATGGVGGREADGSVTQGWTEEPGSSGPVAGGQEADAGVGGAGSHREGPAAQGGSNSIVPAGSFSDEEETLHVVAMAVVLRL